MPKQHYNSEGKQVQQVCSNVPDDNSVSSTNHPLLIPVILSGLFEYLSVEDLHSCRLVCKAWESSSRPQWRSRARLIIDGDRVGRRRGNKGDDDGVEESGDWKNPDLRINFTEFLSFLESPEAERDHKLESIPFSRICIRNGGGSHLPFFERHGLHIRDLHLEWCSDWIGTDFKRILLQLTPNLEVLIVKGSWPEKLGAHREFIAASSGGADDPFPEHEHLKDFHVDIGECMKKDYTLDFQYWLRHFPNIRTLKVRGLDYVEYRSATPRDVAFQRLVNLMKGIVGIRTEAPDKLKLTHLDILDALLGLVYEIEPLVDLFRRAALPLTTLKLDLGSETKESVVQQLLQLHSSTLQRLHCFKVGLAPAGGAEQPPPRSIPYNNFLGDHINYPNLREITLAGYFVLNFNFLQNTPNLEILKHSEEVTRKAHALWTTTALKFNIESTDDTTDASMEVRLEGMKELRGRFTIDSPDRFRKLAEWMPNLEILDVPLNRDTFPVACESWGGSLRELTIRHTSKTLDDEVLSGIPRGWPKRHSRFLIQDRPPNMTNLKVLESFNDFKPESSRVSNHSVFWGFLHLPRLASVFVNVPQEKVNISPLNYSKLEKKKVALKFRQVVDIPYVGDTRVVQRGIVPLNTDPMCLVMTSALAVHLFRFDASALILYNRRRGRAEEYEDRSDGSP